MSRLHVAVTVYHFITIYPSFVRNAAAAALRNLHLHTYQKSNILSSTSDQNQNFVVGDCTPNTGRQNPEPRTQDLRK